MECLVINCPNCNIPIKNKCISCGKTFRKRRDTIVQVPDEWVGKHTYKDTIKARKLTSDEVYREETRRRKRLRESERYE